MISWQANNSFDEVIRIMGRNKHHHITTFGITDTKNLGSSYRKTQTIGKFIHNNKIAYIQGGNHRAARYLEWLKQKRPQDKHSEQNREKGFGVFSRHWVPVNYQSLFQYLLPRRIS